MSLRPEGLDDDLGNVERERERGGGAGEAESVGVLLKSSKYMKYMKYS